MRSTIRRSMTVAVTVLLASAAAFAADPPPSTTTLTVPGMHCGGCAKQMSAALAKVSGVAKTEPDLEAKTVAVTPKAGAVLSPRSLWESLEKIRKVPTKLVGPSGTFISKPKQ